MRHVPQSVQRAQEDLRPGDRSGSRSDLALLRSSLTGALRDVVARQAPLLLQVQGRSMEPTIPAHSSVEIEQLRDPPRVGDVIAFLHRFDLTVCCHRVVAIRADGTVLTAGDNNGAVDGWVEPERQLGRVVGIHCGGRRTDGCGPGVPSLYRRARHRLVSRLARLRPAP